MKGSATTTPIGNSIRVNVNLNCRVITLNQFVFVIKRPN